MVFSAKVNVVISRNHCIYQNTGKIITIHCFDGNTIETPMKNRKSTMNNEMSYVEQTP